MKTTLSFALNAMDAQADMAVSYDGDDRQFAFTLCHEGVNLNGDYFPGEELEQRYMTIIGKKVDIQHSQSLMDTIGVVLTADCVDEPGKGIKRIDCVGKLLTSTSPQARHVYALMKERIAGNVSMECDYESGECSICGKTWGSHRDRCQHVAKFKGGNWQGKPVYEILHGVTFDGVGVLGTKGADENAKITQVASLQEGEQSETTDAAPESLSCMKDAENENADATAPVEPENNEESEMEDELKAQLAELQGHASALANENADLKTQLEAMSARLAEMETAMRQAACRSRAEQFLQSQEQKGLSFANADEREAELTRMASLSDDAFAATVAAVERFTPVKTEVSVSTQGAEAAARPDSKKMVAVASMRAGDVDDTQNDGESLGKMLCAARDERFADRW